MWRQFRKDTSPTTATGPRKFVFQMRELLEYSGATPGPETTNVQQFPGSTKKILQRQSLKSVFVLGISTSYNVGDGDQDPLQWPGVRPPEIDPG